MISRLAAAGWVLLVSAVLIATPLAVRERLPDPMATHWTFGLVPDGAATLGEFLVVSMPVWVVTCAALIAAGAYGRGRARRMHRASWWGLLVGVGTLAMGVNLSTLAANLDVPDWRSALLPGWHLAAVLGCAAVAGTVAGYLGRGEPGEPDIAPPAPPRLRLEPGRQTVWVGQARNTTTVMVGLVVLAFFAVLAFLSTLDTDDDVGMYLSFLPAVVVGTLVVLVTMSLTVRVGGDRVVIGFGPFGWPRRRIRLDTVESAWAEELRATEVGGWGFRGLPGRATIMVRGGECLVLRYRSGGRLAISVDDAAHGASLVNALIAERVNP
ncbi:hypothetical protein [Nonomuraea maritima]|uniref:hypothetical protein n=1 Tax=Nonomuraea maritima TaxID=683260 RepID=UPI00371B741D